MSEKHSTRVRDILATLTLEEKLAQLVGFWQDEDGDVVAPLQGEVSPHGRLDVASKDGLGHLTRVYGTAPYDPEERAAWLWSEQRRLISETRPGIPAIVHEECLTGLAAWTAATFPTPLAWGASFDPDTVERMAALIGRDMHALGIHQGLAPVLDVVRDPRWGRVDECISEDPYLIGVIGTGFVRGLQSSGVHATVKHFAGYSGSKAGRNFAPVSVGPREFTDVYLLPFEMAIHDGGAKSVLHSYTDVDGVAIAGDRSLLNDLLRDQWGFDGVVVADYFGVAFLHLLHEVAKDRREAAALAINAGIDVELPSGDAYLGPLVEAIEVGEVSLETVDRSVLRVLTQKEELGLLDADFAGDPPTGIDLDSPEHRALALEMAGKSVILLSNNGILPLAPKATGRSIAAIGPNMDRPASMFGCYSYVNHVLAQRPGTPLGFEVPSVVDAIREEFDGTVTMADGCDIDSDDVSRIAEAVAAAKEADVAIIAAGDRAGLFGRGTVGEGCDRDSLELPGVQRRLIEEVLDTGTPVVLVLLTGRPYAIGWALERCAAVLQAFFPGEEGARALARIMSGAINPSGCLPVSMPTSVGAQPYSYLHPPLGIGDAVTVLDGTPTLPFGFGLGYSTFAYSGLEVPDRAPTDGAIQASVKVANTGAAAGEHVVQVYGRVRYASVTRPIAQLLGFTRVSLGPGASATVSFEIPTARLAYSNPDFARVVEPRTVEVWVGTSAERSVEASVVLVGDVHVIGRDSPRLTTAMVS
ncbi:MAG: glycoside hydrolase family 3 C-terminal domain-containing protein [Demequinaceae bacterium]|nr:glycoside hydrolase family 3 C-terminal domain-containing protein [Demequinaceae bacterium]